MVGGWVCVGREGGKEGGREVRIDEAKAEGGRERERGRAPSLSASFSLCDPGSQLSSPPLLLLLSSSASAAGEEGERKKKKKKSAGFRGKKSQQQIEEPQTEKTNKQTKK